MDKNFLLTVDFFKTQDLQYAFDSLTQILNREQITGYYSHLLKEKIPFTAALIDVDNFKIINDSYGHMIGDEVLYKFADAVLNSVGEKGFLGRYGGDEFMLIIPQVIEYDDIWQIFHKINQDLGLVKYESIASLEITATTGISRCPVDGTTYEEILSTCDKALYRGKNKGRNCFIIYQPSKHADIDVETSRNRAFNSNEMVSRIFTILNRDNDFKNNIKSLLKFLSSYLLIDNLSIQSNSKICVDVNNILTKNNVYSFIPNEEFDICTNSSGVFFVNAKKSLLQIKADALYERLKNDDLSSVAIVQITHGEINYGTFIAKSLTSHIWQTSELDYFICAAKLIGTILYYTNTTLDELYKED